MANNLIDFTKGAYHGAIIGCQSFLEGLPGAIGELFGIDSKFSNSLNLRIQRVPLSRAGLDGAILTGLSTLVLCASLGGYVVAKGVSNCFDSVEFRSSISTEDKSQSNSNYFAQIKEVIAERGKK